MDNKTATHMVCLDCERLEQGCDPDTCPTLARATAQYLEQTRLRVQAAAPRHGEVLASKYWNCGDHAIAIVAVAGAVGDWAAYIGATDDTSTEQSAIAAAKDGCKLYSQEATALFPALAAAMYRD